MDRDAKRIRTALELIKADLQDSDADYASIVFSSGLDAAAMIDPLITVAGQFLTAHCAETGTDPVEALDRLLAQRMTAEEAD